MIPIGLNPFGLAYSLGLQGRGTPRVNPSPLSLFEYLAFAEEIGASAVIELPVVLLAEAEAQGLLPDVCDWLQERNAIAVIAGPGGLAHGTGAGMGDALRFAAAVKARVVRVTLTRVLQGDRAEPIHGWHDLYAQGRIKLAEAGAEAAKQGVLVAVENHQDVTSTELMELCDESGENVGVCLDTGNALAVGEDPVDFARIVAPRVHHVHIKDYTPQWTDNGYRLVRCAAGDGAIPFGEIFQVLTQGRPANPQSQLTAAIECGALEARLIRCLSPEWWQGYPARHPEIIEKGRQAARLRCLLEDAPYQTPWESGAEGSVIKAYEMEMARRSADNLRALGLLKGMVTS